jgi:hypothetical protein
MGCVVGRRKAEAWLRRRERWRKRRRKKRKIDDADVDEEEEEEEEREERVVLVVCLLLRAREGSRWCKGMQGGRIGILFFLPVYVCMCMDVCMCV